MLPSEKENTELIEKHFAPHLANAAAWLKFSVDAHDDLARTSHADWPCHARAIVSAILVECASRYRCIIELCRLGYSEEAAILLRSLFETHLALRYIVKPSPVTTTHSQELKSVIAKLPPVPATMPPGEFRATLYAASSVIQMDQLGKSPSSWTSAIPDRSRDNMRQSMSEIENAIGADWLGTLRATKSFSGIRTVALLAELCGQSPYYATVYRLQSRSAHGGGSTARITGAQANNIGSSLLIGGCLLGTCIGDVNDVFRLKLDERLREMQSQLAQLDSITL